MIGAFDAIFVAMIGLEPIFWEMEIVNRGIQNDGRSFICYQNTLRAKRLERIDEQTKAAGFRLFLIIISRFSPTQKFIRDKVETMAV